MYFLTRTHPHLSLPYASSFVALKLCRNKTTRKCIIPRTSVLDPQGVYVIKNPEGFSRLADESRGGNPTVGMGYEEVEQEGGMKCSREAPLLYLWIGEQFTIWSTHSLTHSHTHAMSQQATYHDIACSIYTFH